MDVQDIKPELMVHAKLVERPAHEVGASGLYVGTVDHLDGDSYIKLKARGADDGKHHWIPLAWVESVDDKAVYLTKTPEEVASERLDQRPAQH